LQLFELRLFCQLKLQKLNKFCLEANFGCCSFGNCVKIKIKLKKRKSSFLPAFLDKQKESNLLQGAANRRNRNHSFIELFIFYSLTKKNTTNSKNILIFRR